MFFDFHIHGDPEVALNAGKLGYHGVVLTACSRDCINQPETLKNLRKTVEKIKTGKGDNDLHSIQIGVEVEAKNPEDLKKQINKFRKKADVIMVHGGDLKINRAATEDPRVDILSHPYRARFDSGINHVLAVKASENCVAVELNLKYFLLTRPNHRYRVLTQFRQIMKLNRKYMFPVIITSDAGSAYDLRDPHDVMALAACFGMTKDEAFEALSKTPQKIIQRNRIRDDLIVPGARFVR